MTNLHAHLECSAYISLGFVAFTLSQFSWQSICKEGELRMSVRSTHYPSQALYASKTNARTPKHALWDHRVPLNRTRDPNLIVSHQARLMALLATSPWLMCSVVSVPKTRCCHLAEVASDQPTRGWD